MVYPSTHTSIDTTNKYINKSWIVKGFYLDLPNIDFPPPWQLLFKMKNVEENSNAIAKDH